MSTPRTSGALARLDAFLEPLESASPGAVAAGSGLLCAAVALADAVLPPAWPLGGLLTLPVSIASWGAGPVAGAGLGAASAAAWLAADALGAGPASAPGLAWGLAGRLLLLLPAALLPGLLRQSREREREAARTDALTGLLDRPAFVAAATEILARTRQDGAPVTLARLEVEGFKAFSTSHGAGAGDRLLTTLAATLRTSVRAGDVLGRVGGGELAALLPGATLKAAQAIGDKLEDAVVAALAGMELPARARLGLASREGADASTLDDLLRRAGTSMYPASGRRRRASTPPGGTPRRRTTDGGEGGPGQP